MTWFDRCRALLLLSFCLFSVTSVAPAQTNLTTVPVGSHPTNGVVDLGTNQVYVGSGSFRPYVRIIDGVTNTTQDLDPFGNSVENPANLSVNNYTNKVYVANQVGTFVTVIDTPSNGTTSISIGGRPRVVIVNQQSNKIYVAHDNQAVSIIDGATTSVTSVTTGSGQFGVSNRLAIDPANNKIYVANIDGSGAIIDGSTNGVSLIGTLTISTDPLNDLVRVTGSGGSTLATIPGLTNVTVYTDAINPSTDRLYSATGCSAFTITDRSTNRSASVPLANFSGLQNCSRSVVINPQTNRVYVICANAAIGQSGNVLVLDDTGPNRFTISAPPAVVAGDSFSVTVTAINVFGDSIPSYRGTIHFSSTNAGATLPADYTFGPGDSGSHTFDNLRFTTAGTVTLTVTDAAAANLVGSLDINVTEAPSCIRPTIITQPQNQTIVSGDRATLFITFAGPQPVTIQWYQGFAPDTTIPVRDATGPSFTTTPLNSTTAFWARVTNTCGSTNSSTAIVSVCSPPVIMTQPQNVMISPGQASTLSVVAAGTAPLDYQWFEGQSGDSNRPIGGATSTSYTTPPLAATTSYWVQVSNACGRVNSSTVQVVTPRRRAARH